jgi:hypothetical protein
VHAGAVMFAEERRRAWCCGAFEGNAWSSGRELLVHTALATPRGRLASASLAKKLPGSC